MPKIIHRLSLEPISIFVQFFSTPITSPFILIPPFGAQSAHWFYNLIALPNNSAEKQIMTKMPKRENKRHFSPLPLSILFQFMSEIGSVRKFASFFHIHRYLWNALPTCECSALCVASVDVIHRTYESNSIARLPSLIAFAIEPNSCHDSLVNIFFFFFVLFLCFSCLCSPFMRLNYYYYANIYYQL